MCMHKLLYWPTLGFRVSVCGLGVVILFFDGVDLANWLIRRA
jgi:hypothetical protein